MPDVPDDRFGGGAGSADPTADTPAQLRAVIEATPDALVVIDGDGRVRLVNREAERLFGHPRARLLTMSANDLLPERLRLPAGRRWRANPTRRRLGEADGLAALRSDGAEVPIEIAVSELELDGDADGGGELVLAAVRDLTSRIAARTRAESELRRSMLDSIPFSVLATDRDGLIVAANPGAEALLGRAAATLVGRSITEVHDPAGADAADASALLAARAGCERETGYVRADGAVVPVSEGVSELRNQDGSLRGYLAVAHDITARLQAQAAVHRMTTHDPMTNLPNRTLLEQYLAQSVAEAVANGRTGVVLLLDLDHFKNVNDSLGHHVGDLVLAEVAERLRRWADDEDLVARFGGDEFVIVINDARVMPSVESNLFDQLTMAMTVHGHDLATSVSIGGALFPRHGTDAAELIQHADTAMYAAKSAGRNQLQWFEHGMRVQTNERMSLASALRQALREEELSVAYQPQVELDTGVTIGFEALARWESRTLGTVGPERFIPVAEDTGMIVDLGAWVLERACEDIARIQAELGRPLRLGVNVSPRQFRSRGWVDTVLSTLERTGLQPSQLELEITEGVLMDERWQVIDTLRALRDRGVSIAIDDFGLGYSSLAYLTRFPIDKLKIDRAFVRELEPDEGRAPIIDAIVVMAHALGMRVVAEGVEKPEQATYLRNRGCDEAQGFLYSAAVEPQHALRAAGGA
ncbi:putative bifunctional diguanylate cyclase/phosphodiesterase [Nocardioides sambongensis]|uniref:putative bifunctional diguanylate cyclase/phosphodiesterase n=1 Tax=Nocardioides sambongensis TaxID=2589074 RepID=UPI00112ACC99|nr:EAL domain-containing protein [Nocardioides sambongensis]